MGRCCDWFDPELDEHDNRPERIYTPEELAAWGASFFNEYLTDVLRRIEDRDG